MNMTGYAPTMTNMAPQLNPQRSQIAALMGSRPGMGMPAPQAMPPAMPMPNAPMAPAQNGLNLSAPMGQPPMGTPAMPRPVMRMPQSMMR